eukprot:1086007-Prymnesium_polylepis.1
MHEAERVALAEAVVLQEMITEDEKSNAVTEMASASTEASIEEAVEAPVTTEASIEAAVEASVSTEASIETAAETCAGVDSSATAVDQTVADLCFTRTSRRKGRKTSVPAVFKAPSEDRKVAQEREEDTQRLAKQELPRAVLQGVEEARLKGAEVGRDNDRALCIG